MIYNNNYNEKRLPASKSKILKIKNLDYLEE